MHPNNIGKRAKKELRLKRTRCTTVGRNPMLTSFAIFSKSFRVTMKDTRVSSISDKENFGTLAVDIRNRVGGDA